MFADLMNFDNLRRNTLEFVAIIEMKFASDGQAVLDKKISSYVTIARTY